ncbi:MAG: hypothetical protein LBU14_02725 [Candidatus Peribacteria bacterium]|nr:hypothetical protein [Candidatus Peribacteria bacterium]
MYIIANVNNLVVFYDNKVAILKSTLIKVDFVEMTEIDRVTKFDAYLD